MSWVDDLDSDDDERHEELRLHEAQIIRAKAPVFWDSVVQHLREDTNKLRDRFQHNSRYHCNVSPSANGVTISGKTFPRKILQLKLNVLGLCVELREDTQLSQFEAETIHKRDVIDIKVEEQGQVGFQFKGKVFDYPHSLSEELVRYVCGI